MLPTGPGSLRLWLCYVQKAFLCLALIQLDWVQQYPNRNTEFGVGLQTEQVSRLPKRLLKLEAIKCGPSLGAIAVLLCLCIGIKLCDVTEEWEYSSNQNYRIQFYWQPVCTCSYLLYTSRVWLQFPKKAHPVISICDSCDEGLVTSWPVTFCNCRRIFLFTTNKSRSNAGYLGLTFCWTLPHAGFEDDT